MLLSLGAKRKLLQAQTYIQAYQSGNAIAHYQAKYKCSMPEAQAHIAVGVQAIRGFEDMGFTVSDINTLVKEVGL